MEPVSGHSGPSETGASGTRWIRPAKGKRSGARGPGGTHSSPGVAGAEALGGPAGGLLEEQSIERWAAILLEETRQRVSGLTELERQLEDRIRRRWEESSAEVDRYQQNLRDDVRRMRCEAEKDIEGRRHQAEADGRSEGFRDGFARGRDEGYRLGLEEGRREGLQAGQREGQEQGARQITDDLSNAAASMARAAQVLSQDRARLIEEARSEVLALAMRIARRVVRRELMASPDVALRTVEAAVELIFRRGSLVVQVHPADAPHLERALQAEPRWIEGFEVVEVHASGSVTRGGCRLVSGAGTVDMTIETQMELIENALEEAIQRPESAEVTLESEPEQAERREGESA